MRWVLIISKFNKRVVRILELQSSLSVSKGGGEINERGNNSKTCRIHRVSHHLHILHNRSVYNGYS